MIKKDSKDSVSKISHVGPRSQAAFSRIGIESVEDLFRYIPRKVVDISAPVAISRVGSFEGQKVAVYVEIEDLKILKTPRRHIWVISANIRDDSGVLRVVWFNQPYLRNFFSLGKKYIFYGNVEYNFFIKEKAMVSPEIFEGPKVMPIYHLTEGLSSKQIQRAVRSALDDGYQLSQLICDKDISKYGLMEGEKALLNLHFPKSVAEFNAAKERFIFDELLTFISANLYLKNQSKKQIAPKITTSEKELKSFVQSLPFTLTDDQRKAIEDIVNDFKSPHPMNRLLQGDVGSGKTVVALAAAYLVIKSGYRVAYLAPTQILAQQHFETAKKLFESFGVKVGLLTAETAKKSKSKNSKIGQLDQYDLIIGTHAIIQKNIKIPNLALVIVDEQHRFGVEQRNALLQSPNPESRRAEPPARSASGWQPSGRRPHFLSLSATPIPRTLAHIIFGNLDISTIYSKPVGRLKVKTYLIPSNKRDDSYKFIDELIKDGQQAFVICPLIEKKEEFSDTLFELSERKAVESEIKNLQKTILGKRKIEMLHGKMKGTEKEEKMQRMQNGQTDVLVSTSVVEVGIDVPGATVMIIEEAEQFGLSQLHQFRGRVGRNDLQSYCFLFTRDILNDKSKARLKAFVQNDDGFKLAQMDLKGRGPGAVLGLNQSGFAEINPIWFENSEVLSKASKAANEIIPKLENNPALLEKVREKLQTKHLE